MNIGSFAKRNQISIDTIRHYVDMGLIIPAEDGVEYEFDPKCQSDIEEVSRLKSIGFSLSEILSLLLYHRIGQLTKYEKKMSYRSYFENKLDYINLEIQRLDLMRTKLTHLLGNISSSENTVQKISLGLPLESLKYFSCPKCKQTLNFLDGNVENGQIITGRLSCESNHTYIVIDGIFMGDGIPSEESINPLHDTFVDDYISTTDVGYMRNLFNALEWTKKNVSFDSISDGVAMELGPGHGFFMRHFLDSFPSNSTYIAVDSNPKALNWLKKVLERNAPKFKVLFICADFKSIPIKPSIVDMMFDISGTNNESYDGTKFLLDEVVPLLNNVSELHFYHILKAEADRKIKLDHEQIKKAITNIGFQSIDEFVSESSEIENIRSYFYYGKRLG